MTNPLSQYDQEALTALYAALTFIEENDLPAGDVINAIKTIEAKTKAA